MLKIKFVASVSSGASSAIAADMILQKFPAESVDLIFADTLHEDVDNYRFLDDLEKRWKRKITRLIDGRTPEQVWDDRGLIPNDQICPCTFELKLKLIIDYVKNLQDQGYRVVMVVGYSAKDLQRRSPKAKNYPDWVNELYPGRMLATTMNWAAKNVMVIYPARNVTDVKHVVETVWGIKLPRMYGMDFLSANCSGDCPKGGVKHWINVLEKFPDVFERRAAWERKKRKNPKFSKYTILTKQVNKKRINYSLDDLRKDYENSKNPRVLVLEADLDNVCVIGECGVGYDD